MYKQVWKYKDENIEFEMGLNFYLKDFVDHFEKLDELTANWGETIEKEVHKRFVSERGPHGVPWLPLSGLTIRNKRTPSMLQETMRLKKAITVWSYADYVQVGVNLSEVPYAKVHQKGKKNIRTTKKQAIWMWANLFDKQGPPYAIKRFTILARPFLGWDKKLSDDVFIDAQRYFKQAENLGQGDI